MTSRSIPGRARDAVGRRSARGTRALTAEHAEPPGRSCVGGELVWTPDPCDDRPCPCERGFTGVASGGVTAVARVRLLPGTSRAELRRALVDCMGAHGCPPVEATRRADRLLDTAAGLPDGTLLRLEQGVPVALPPGSRMRGRGTVVAPADEHRR